MSSEGKKVDMSKATPFLKFLASAAGRVVLFIVFALIIWGLMSAAININEFVCLILAVALGYFGWQQLNKITPALFVWMPIGAWLVYFLVKGILSVLIGYFVAPFWLAKKVSGKVMKYVDAGIDVL